MHLNPQLPVLVGLVFGFLSIATGLTLPISNSSYHGLSLVAPSRRYGTFRANCCMEYVLKAGFSLFDHSENVSPNVYEYKIPNTMTTLLITFSYPMERRKARSFLLETIGDVMEKRHLLGKTTRLPNDGYDDKENGLEFSAYSPPELAKEVKLTWGILKDVLDGVLSVVAGNLNRQREINFSILHGKRDQFTGYGFFINGRPSNTE